MNIEQTGAPGSMTIGVHEITDPAELDKYLAGDGKEVKEGEEGEGNDDGGKGKKPGAQPPTPKAGKEGKEGSERQQSQDGEDDDEGGEGEGKEQNYPTMLHMLNEVHELGLNLGAEDRPTIEEQAEAVSEILSKMTEGVNNALAHYSHIEELLGDPEVKRVLELKAQKKTMKDIVAEFASTPQGMSDDDLVINDFKKRYPKATPEMITSMIEPLKKNGQFAVFATGLREQSAEEQRLSAENAEKQRLADEQAQQQRDQQELNTYLEFVGNQTHVFGMPLTDQMKSQIVNMTTKRDEKGMTYLDHALQSNEGTVLAILGIAFMQDLMKNGASVEGNRKNHKFVNKLFQRPDSLQSTGGSTQKDEFDPAIANKF